MKAPFYFLLFLFFSISGFGKDNSLLKDSTKIKETNRKKMVGLQRALDSAQIGSMAPNFRFVSNKGDSVQLSSFRGKIIVIDFWATWCPPCVAQFPFYETLKQKFKGKEVVFLSVSIDDSKNRWEKYIKNHNPSDIQLWGGPYRPAYYYTLMDSKTMERADSVSAHSVEAKKMFNAGLTIFDGVPGNIVIIGTDGKLVDNWLWASKGSEMEDKINALLVKMKK